MDNDELTLLMLQFCALNNAEEEPVSREEAIVEGKLKQSILLGKSRRQVRLGSVGSDMEQTWYLGASNHMTGDKSAFSELDVGVIGCVKFGDGSKVNIRGHDTIVFRCQNREHRALSTTSLNFGRASLALGSWTSACARSSSTTAFCASEIMSVVFSPRYNAHEIVSTCST